MKIGELSLIDLRKICDSIPGRDCEMRCPILGLCQLADNDIKKAIEKELKFLSPEDEEYIKKVLKK